MPVEGFKRGSRHLHELGLARAASGKGVDGGEVEITVDWAAGVLRGALRMGGGSSGSGPDCCHWGASSGGGFSRCVLERSHSSGLDVQDGLKDTKRGLKIVEVLPHDLH